MEEANKQLMESFNNKDAAAVAAHYTDDGAMLPPNEERIQGRENIQKLWQGWIDAGVTGLTLKALEVVEGGDIAFEEGAYTLKAPGADGKLMEDVGKYVVVWKKGPGGAWQLYRDIWNTSQPAPQ
ncbi:YybH family protein [Arvimicrobium flavum]|uniref:YybH family protein n=1 Tax=Arvimicrobium flavum TaxID=3393320 RepID=UPI00237A3AD5|nr:DUF4440 domain-containing protein [Mesorhizobium shangrilense]